MLNAEQQIQVVRRPRVRIGLALGAVALAVVLYVLASRMGGAHSVLQGLSFGTAVLLLGRLSLEMVADAVGEGGFDALADKRKWLRPVALALYFVGMLIYALWRSGSL